MSELLVLFSVFGGVLVIGYWIVSRVPPLLHTPLMSLTNAVSAVTLLGAFLLFAEPVTPAEAVLGGCAIAAAAFNVVGGFAITDRMLRLFRRR